LTNGITVLAAGVKIFSIRLLVICLLTWLSATPTKVVYSLEDQQRQKKAVYSFEDQQRKKRPFTLSKNNKGKKGRLLFRRTTKAKK
jgi:hypothetical protein